MRLAALLKEPIPKFGLGVRRLPTAVPDAREFRVARTGLIFAAFNAAIMSREPDAGTVLSSAPWKAQRATPSIFFASAGDQVPQTGTAAANFAG